MHSLLQHKNDRILIYFPNSFEIQVLEDDGWSTKPQYPVINGDPSFGDIVANYGVKDLLYFGGGLGGGIGYGYLAGYRNRVQPPMMLVGGILGGLGGFMLAYQNSFGRLMGLKPN